MANFSILITYENFITLGLVAAVPASAGLQLVKMIFRMIVKMIVKIIVKMIVKMIVDQDDNYHDNPDNDGEASK